MKNSCMLFDSIKCLIMRFWKRLELANLIMVVLGKTLQSWRKKLPAHWSRLSYWLSSSSLSCVRCSLLIIISKLASNARTSFYFWISCRPFEMDRRSVIHMKANSIKFFNSLAILHDTACWWFMALLYCFIVSWINSNTRSVRPHEICSTGSTNENKLKHRIRI